MSLLLTPNTAIESSFESSAVDLSFGDPPPLFSAEMNPGVFADSNVLEGNTESDVLDGNTESGVLESNTHSGVLNGNTEFGVLEGNTHSDVLEGNTESDVLEGNTHSDVLDGNTESGVLEGNTHSKEWSDATDSKEWSDATLRAYVMLDLTSVVLYEDYTLSLLLQNYTGDVTIRTSRHVRLHSHPHA